MTAAATDLTDDSLFTADDPEDDYTDFPPEPEPAAGGAEEPDADLAPDENAPYGYMRDRATGEKRPKRRSGRPRAPKTAEELAAAPPVAPEPDKPPEAPRRRSRVAAAILPSPSPAPAPPASEPDMPRAGYIAKRTNALYRRAGKLVRVWNYPLGMAFIECTRADPDDEDDVTVGQAWENLAKENPRIRAWLLNLIKGGDWQDLVMAHAPIGVAIVTSTWVGRILPLGRLAASMLEPEPEELEEEEAPEEGAAPRLMPEDAEQMMQTAQAQAQKIAAKMGVKVPANVARAAMAEAQRHARGMGIPGAGAPITPPYDQHDLSPDPEGGEVLAGVNGNGPPAAYRRQQPKHTSRSQRRR